MRRSPWRPAIAWKIGSAAPLQFFDTRSAAATSRRGSQVTTSCGGKQDGMALPSVIVARGYVARCGSAKQGLRTSRWQQRR